MTFPTSSDQRPAASGAVASDPMLADAAPSAGDAGRLARGVDGHQSEWKRRWRRFRAYPPAVPALAFIILLVITAILAPVIAPHEPLDNNLRLRGDGPSSGYWLGNDANGRDMLSRLLYGTRIALLVGIGATTIAVTIGVLVGASSGYFGGWVDLVLSRLVDSLMAFPTIALLLVLAAVLSPSIPLVVLIIGFSVWASYARVVRAEVLSLKQRDFVLAAEASGATSWRIIVRHIIPNVVGVVIVLWSLAVGGVIIYESALSFLGLGVQPPNPSWGRMLADGRDYIREYPHIMIAPGIFITVTVLAFNLLGEGLRDAFDPRGRR
ncbi:MAG TPA: ABC transporter permease [Thermomicrobiales bacterium]|jgi:peptide/nickel transport system permease protein|nr:ABC transporter permease [Thermomicrobiales bacterium]